MFDIKTVDNNQSLIVFTPSLLKAYLECFLVLSRDWFMQCFIVKISS